MMTSKPEEAVQTFTEYLQEVREESYRHALSLGASMREPILKEFIAAFSRELNRSIEFGHQANTARAAGYHAGYVDALIAG